MTRLGTRRRLVAACLLAAASLLGPAPPDRARAEPSLVGVRLTLPPVAYAVVGDRMGVYFDNLVLHEHPERLRFSVDCQLGVTEERGWFVVPELRDVGEHPWRIEVFERGEAPGEERRVAEGSMIWRVSPRDAGAGRELALLIVGDSLTNATQYPAEISRRLGRPDQASWTLLGTHRPAGAPPGVVHEGYGGWTWARFATHYEPQPDPDQRKHSSPFVFLGADGKPGLDVPRYLRESCGGRRPDYVTFLLGINDCFSAPADDPAGADARIEGMFEHAETLLRAFREAAPDAQLGVCLTTPPNSREEAFTANYQGRYTRRNWRRIQHRLVERELAQFGGREDSRIFVVPTELYLDPIDGYPENNGVHPNAAGYQQIGASIHAWLQAQLTAR